MNTFFVIIIAYFLGAIPSAYVFGKVFGKINIMEHGSGNVGTTNTFRVLGWKIGSLVFLFDVAKGLLPCYFGYLVGGEVLALICGLIAILGHTFSVFIKFKGGKGVATSAGVLLFLEPLTLLCALIIWILISYFTGYISLASILAGISSILFLFLFGANTFIIVAVTIVVLYIIYKHKSNIKRLINGTESKINWKEKINKRK